MLVFTKSQQDIKEGTHPQFVLCQEKGKVMCKCGATAIWWVSDYVCSSITTHRFCKYSKK